MREQIGYSITSGTVEQHILHSYQEMCTLSKKYEKGFMSETELRICLLSIFYDGFYGFLKRSGLHIRLKSSTWDSFLEDNEHWHQGIKLDDSKSITWLETSNTQEANVWRITASVNDRANILRLMSAFHLIPDYFTPIPDDIKRPNLFAAHTWASSSFGLLFFKCSDNDGLLMSMNPCGKTFVLKNEQNLRAVVKIKDRFSPAIRKFDSNVDYYGEGWIESYTKESNGRKTPEIYIGLSEGIISHLLFNMSSEDWAAHQHHQLWTEYYKWEATLREKSLLIRDEFIKPFIRGPIPDSSYMGV